MGKMRRARQRSKLTSAKQTLKSIEVAIEVDKTSTSNGVNSSLFSGINIETSTLETKLPYDFDTGSVKSKKTGFTGNINKLKKKEKRKIRRQAFLSSIANIHQKRKDSKGDVKSLKAKRDKNSTLNQMKSAASNHKKPNPDTKSRIRKKIHQQQKETKEDIETFGQVLKNPSFQVNPEFTILQHLRILAETEK